MPQHFVPGSTYGQLQEILLEYIARTSRGAAAPPKIAYVYSDGEFGRDGIPAAKARAEKLGLPIVAEIVTRSFPSREDCGRQPNVLKTSGVA